MASSSIMIYFNFTCLFLALLAWDGLCEFMGFAHQHGECCIVGPEQIDHLVKRHVCYQVTTHHQDVRLMRKVGKRRTVIYSSCCNYFTV